MLTTSQTLRGVAVMGLLGLSVSSGEACDRYRPVYTSYVYVTRPVVLPPAPIPVPGYQSAALTVQTVAAQKAVVGAEIIARRPAIRPGEKVRVPLKFAGADRGQASLKFGVLKLNCEILEWSNTHVVCALPLVELEEDVPAQLEVLRSNGTTAREFGITLESLENGVTVYRDPVVLPSQATALSTTR